MVTTVFDMIMPRPCTYVNKIVFDALEVYLIVLNRILSGNTQKTVVQIGGELNYEYLDRFVDFYNNRQLGLWTTYTVSQHLLLFGTDEKEVFISAVNHLVMWSI